MKKRVVFEYFGEGQYLEFNIQRLGELEAALGGEPIADIIPKLHGIRILVAGLATGLKQHYPNRPQSYFASLVDAYMDNGGTITDLYLPLAKALMVTGIFGREIAEKAEQAQNMEDLGDDAPEKTEGDEKNAGQAMEA